MGLNSPSDCPILEWTQGGQRKVEAEEEASRFRDYRGELRASIIGTDYAIVHPAAPTNEKPIEFFDSDVACRLFSLSGMFDEVKCISRMGAMRISRAKVATLFVSDGRILVSGPGPPGAETLSPLAMLIWGATIP